MKMFKLLSRTVSALLVLTLLIATSSVYADPLQPIDPIVPPFTLLPSAPSNLTGTFDASGNIILNWNDNSSNETSFELSMEGTLGGGIIPLGANATTYTDSTGHVLGETYTFKIRAKNSFGTSAWSNTIDMTPSKPAKPTNIFAKLEADGKIKITWNDNSNNETSFDLLMESDGSGGDVSVGANTTTYVDATTHHVGNMYTFSIRARNAFGTSAWSNTSSVTISMPTKPNNVTAVVESNGDVTVNWSDQSNNETSFEISISDGSGGDIKSVGEGITTFTDSTSHTPLTTYTYKVRARNFVGSSAWSSPATVVIPAVILVPPNAPSNLTATVNSDGSITLNWNDNSNNETGFEVDITDGSGGTAETVGPNIKTYKFENPTVGKTYTFKVKAKNLMGSSFWSNSVSVLIEEAEDDTNQTGGIFDGTQSSWAKDELQQAFDYGLTYPTIMNHYTQQITREEFCTIVVKLYEKLTGNSATIGTDPFNDTSDSEILKAYKLGIVQGKSSDKFVPYDYITREEICVMILRCLQAADPQLDVSLGNSFNFDDADLIDSWALTAMKFCNKNDIMKGVGGNKIGPLQNTQRQEAIVLLKRTYDKYK